MTTATIRQTDVTPRHHALGRLNKLIGAVH
jgi:hypothetical protein